MAIFLDLKGTTVDNLQLGKGGPKFQNTAGDIHFHAPNLVDYVDLFANVLRATGNELVLNTNAPNTGNNRKYTIKRPTTGMTQAIELHLPPNYGTAGQFLQSDGAGNMTWASAGGGASGFTELTGPVNISGTYNGLLRVIGDATITGNLTVKGDLKVTGRLICRSNYTVTIEGNANLGLYDFSPSAGNDGATFTVGGDLETGEIVTSLGSFVSTAGTISTDYAPESKVGIDVPATRVAQDFLGFYLGSSNFVDTTVYPVSFSSLTSTYPPSYSSVSFTTVDPNDSLTVQAPSNPTNDAFFSGVSTIYDASNNSYAVVTYLGYNGVDGYDFIITNPAETSISAAYFAPQPQLANNYITVYAASNPANDALFSGLSALYDAASNSYAVVTYFGYNGVDGYDFEISNAGEVALTTIYTAAQPLSYSGTFDVDGDLTSFAIPKAYVELGGYTAAVLSIAGATYTSGTPGYTTFTCTTDYNVSNAGFTAGSGYVTSYMSRSLQGVLSTTTTAFDTLKILAAQSIVNDNYFSALTTFYSSVLGQSFNVTAYTGYNGVDGYVFTINNPSALDFSVSIFNLNRYTQTTNYVKIPNVTLSAPLSNLVTSGVNTLKITSGYNSGYSGNILSATSYLSDLVLDLSAGVVVDPNISLSVDHIDAWFTIKGDAGYSISENYSSPIVISSSGSLGQQRNAIAYDNINLFTTELDTPFTGYNPSTRVLGYLTELSGAKQSFYSNQDFTVGTIISDGSSTSSISAVSGVSGTKFYTLFSQLANPILVVGSSFTATGYEADTFSLNQNSAGSVNVGGSYRLIQLTGDTNTANKAIDLNVGGDLIGKNSSVVRAFGIQTYILYAVGTSSISLQESVITLRGFAPTYNKSGGALKVNGNILNFGYINLDGDIVEEFSCSDLVCGYFNRVATQVSGLIKPAKIYGSVTAGALVIAGRPHTQSEQSVFVAGNVEISRQLIPDATLQFSVTGGIYSGRNLAIKIDRNTAITDEEFSDVFIGGNVSSDYQLYFLGDIASFGPTDTNYPVFEIRGDIYAQAPDFPSPEKYSAKFGDYGEAIDFKHYGEITYSGGPVRIAIGRANTTSPQIPTRIFRFANKSELSNYDYVRLYCYDNATFIKVINTGASIWSFEHTGGGASLELTGSFHDVGTSSIGATLSNCIITNLNGVGGYTIDQCSIYLVNISNGLAPTLTSNIRNSSIWGSLTIFDNAGNASPIRGIGVSGSVYIGTLSFTYSGSFTNSNLRVRAVSGSFNSAQLSLGAINNISFFTNKDLSSTGNPGDPDGTIYKIGAGSTDVWYKITGTTF